MRAHCWESAPTLAASDFAKTPPSSLHHRLPSSIRVRQRALSSVCTVTSRIILFARPVDCQKSSFSAMLAPSASACAGYTDRTRNDVFEAFPLWSLLLLLLLERRSRGIDFGVFEKKRKTAQSLDSLCWDKKSHTLVYCQMVCVVMARSFKRAPQRWTLSNLYCFVIQSTLGRQVRQSRAHLDTFDSLTPGLLDTFTPRHLDT